MAELGHHHLRTAGHVLHIDDDEYDMLVDRLGIERAIEQHQARARERARERARIAGERRRQDRDARDGGARRPRP